MSYGQLLRREVESAQITPLIGIFDMYSASVAARHYGGLFVSGFGFAASHYGLPDIGFIAWPDMVNFVQRLRLAFPRQHLLVDIDDGYVDPEVACHVVQHLERIGASGSPDGPGARSSSCAVMPLLAVALFTAGGTAAMFLVLAAMYVLLAAAAVFAPETMGRSLEDINPEDRTTATAR
jgi:hypothetical protein